MSKKSTRFRSCGRICKKARSTACSAKCWRMTTPATWIARAFQRMQEDTVHGEFGGIGIMVGIRDERLTIISPIVGTPGFRAGLRGGDLIKRWTVSHGQHVAGRSGVADPRTRGRAGRADDPAWRRNAGSGHRAGHHPSASVETVGTSLRRKTCRIWRDPSVTFIFRISMKRRWRK